MIHRSSQTLTAEEMSFLRFRGLGLVDSLASPSEAASRTIGIQAQDQSAAGLALRARCPGFSSVDLARSLYNDRSLVKLWAARNTLHLHASEDWPLIFGAHAGEETPFERQARKRGVDLEVFRKTILTFIEHAARKPWFDYQDLQSADLGLGDFEVSGWTAGWGDLCLTLERHGPICHGETEGSKSRFVHQKQWLPHLAWRPPTRDDANKALIRRFIVAYGPATIDDITHWLGGRIAEVRGWIEEIGADVTTIDVDGMKMLADKAAFAAASHKMPRQSKSVRLLGKYDPLLLAYKDKSWLVPLADQPRVWRSGGRVEAVVLVGQAVVGTWRYRRTRERIDLTIAPFPGRPEIEMEALKKEALGVAAYFGVELGKVVIAGDK